MPAWIKEREERLEPEMRKTYGPEKAEQVAWAVATQEAHATGKSPKTFHGKPFGTPEGRRNAKEKYDEPSKMQKSAGEPTEDQVAKFLSDHPNPPDEEFHAWAESNGWDPDDAEAVAYRLATRHSQFALGGKANEAGKTPADVNQGQLAKGVIVEKEHTPNLKDRERISADHIVEDSEYYDNPLFVSDLKKSAGPNDPSLWGYARRLLNLGLPITDVQAVPGKWPPLPEAPKVQPTDAKMSFPDPEFINTWKGAMGKKEAELRLQTWATLDALHDIMRSRG